MQLAVLELYVLKCFQCFAGNFNTSVMNKRKFNFVDATRRKIIKALTPFGGFIYLNCLWKKL